MIGLSRRFTAFRTGGMLLTVVLILKPLAGFAASVPTLPLVPAIKATFVYKFAPFVVWPASAFPAADTPVTICVVGDDPVARLIDDAVAGQRIDGRTILVRHLDRIERTIPCHELYAAGTSAQTVAQAFAAVQGLPVLTISDTGSVAAQGMIAFVVDGDRVRFDIDEGLAVASGLTLNSRLLSLGRRVTGRGR